MCSKADETFVIVETYEAVCLNFISQLFWFLKATFCSNFYEIFKKNPTKMYALPSVILRIIS